MDVATPQFWTEAVFGLTSGWWRFTDRDLRPVHPLLGRAQWETVLREPGFSETDFAAGLIGPQGEGQIGLLARKAWQHTDHCADRRWNRSRKNRGSSSRTQSGLGDQLAARLRAAGARCRIAHRGETVRRRHGRCFHAPRRGAGGLADSFSNRARRMAPVERIVYLWNLDAPQVDDDAAMGTDALLHLAQALEATQPDGETAHRFRHARRAAGGPRHASRPRSRKRPPSGLFRVILNEHPNFACRGIDLPPAASAVRRSSALERTAPRTMPSAKSPSAAKRVTCSASIAAGRSVEQTLDPAVPLRLESRERGHLDTLRFAPFALPPCGPGEVLIDVKAAGMNFRDVLKALALYPGEAPDARIFGDEVGGIVTAVGADVTHVAPGDRVFGLAVFGLATQTLARGGDVRRIPAGLSFEEAATLPVVFMTSWHALKNVARLRKGERILVHAGAGGVGMAAIQIAHHLGAEVIATAGSPAKRALLETLGVKHVIDSRRGDFAEAVMELTDRRGVDVVLNALAGEAIPMGLSCLAEFGRFIEIGKRDIYQNSRIPLWPLRRNASFHVVAMDAVFSGDEELTREMLAELADLVEKGALRPLPFRAFPASRIDAAFRLMAGGKHIGKVVVSFPEPFVPRRGEPLAPPFAIKPDGCYLITGAFGGFGKVLAQWLVQCGARHLVLTSRSGASTPEAEAFVQSLRDRGVEVQVVKADVGSPQDVARLLAEIRAGGQPLRGVFHLAMVIDDAPLAALTRERMQTRDGAEGAAAPGCCTKARATWRSIAS